ncbi:MAG: hypothetical protein KC731_31125 [Myxococcales bacterium]|nr:hypothetical protein [Myxococcales bacterium]
MRLAILTGAAFLGLGFVFAIEAHAQLPPEQRMLAETLFQEGKRLMAEDDWSEACRKLEESYRIEPLPGVLLNLAVCHEAEGLTATAWLEFKESIALAKIDRRRDRRVLAERRLAELEPLLARLRVVVEGPGPDGLEVVDDATILPSPLWGSARAVDPGTHRIRASAPGHLPFEATVDAIPEQTVTVTIPALEPQPAPAPPPAPPSLVYLAPPPLPILPPPPLAEPSASPWPAVGYSLVGLGGAALAVGTAFGVHALVKEGQAEERCDDRSCPDPSSLALSDAANGFASAANVLLLSGGLVAAGGVIVLLVGPDEETVTLSSGPGALGLRARF